ncbi:porin [Prosthecodimorpha staleyi]|uniref:Porin n=1 Tax=Prosthecodimorpha staleyi TaxID=2840188 RepID=A0A947GDA5_9HYPH|nr:porin [Prosthecodimorpha staleyi]MBT9290076.1 porin [Prosthecodimorpha staleyi]
MKFKLATMAAAMFAATGAASAADLGRPAPAAVDYVKVCDAYGAGFFYIPGSQTCLKIGGYVRAEYRAYDFDNAFAALAGKTVGTNDPTHHDFTTRVRAQVTLDARTNTEFGLLRSFTEAWWTVDSGSSSPTVTLWNAYIQFGGLTAGRAQSFFDFYTGTTYGSYFEAAHSDTKVNLLAYTFSFGNGVSASLSLEDPTTGSNSRRLSSMFAAPFTITGPTSYGGVKMLDVVGNVRIAQAWGSAQLMAAAHENTNNFNNTTKWGYAVGGGVTVNLPMLAAGDTINLQAVYSKGAVAYAGADLSMGALDFVQTGKNNLAQSTAWSVAGGFVHYWTPKISTAVNGSYLKVDTATTSFLDYKQLDAQANIVYTIVPGMTIGGELEYRKIDFTKGGDTDALVGLLRFQRNF